MCLRCSLSALVLMVVLISGCSRPKTPELGEPIDSAYRERGRYLVVGLAACGFCHGATNSSGAALSGGMVFHDKFGNVQAGNLTSSSFGLGDWSPNQIVKAVRSSIGKDGEVLSKDFHRGYEWMSDRDLVSIVAYLRSLPPVDGNGPKRSIGFLDRNTVGFFDSWSEIKGYVPDIGKSAPLEYGKYLVDHVARCGSCHNTESGWFSGGTYLGGGAMIRTSSGERYAPSIGPSVVDGLGDWSESEIVKYLKSGVTPSGEVVDSDFCPVTFYANAEATDLGFIAKYLKSLE